MNKRDAAKLDELSQGENETSLGAVRESTKSTESAHFADVSINGCCVCAKVDTGAQVTVISDSFPGLPPELEPTCDLGGPNNDTA